MSRSPMTNTAKDTGTLHLTTPTEREIVLTQDFDARRSVISDALRKTELLKRSYGPQGADGG